jgi:protein-S-isoprenylcysteine O-methyltransferase Ste14
MGADHFDPSYRGGKLETRGIFRHVRNPGYAVGLLILYHAGLLWESALALIVAAVHHAFVWVAWFCTEQPDLRVIYGDESTPRES